MKKLIYYPCLLAASLILISCGGDDPKPPDTVPDTEKPVITVLSPTDITKPLRATVSVKAEAKDNTGIKKVEVFVDGISLISATTSPVEASWDTKKVTDGTHEIKIVAEDTEGNKEERALSVEVKNILFTFNIGASYLRSLTAGWIFITDDAGSLISNQEVLNGKSITVETPEGFTNDKTYTFTILQYYLEDFGFGSSKDVFITSYVKVASGAFVLDFGTFVSRPEVGTHDLVITGIPVGQYQNRNVTSLDAQITGYVGPEPNGAPVRASLFKTPAKVIYKIQDADEIPLKYEVAAAVSGGSLEVDITDFTPFDSFIIPLPGAQSSNFGISMVKTPGDYVNTIFFDSGEQSINADQLSVFYPNLTPHEFITGLRYNTDVDYFSYTLTSSQLPTTFKKLEAEVVSVTPSSSKISVNATGDFQLLSLNSTQSIFENNNFSVFSWDIFVGKDSKDNIIIPPLPDVLKQKYPDVATHSFTFDFVWLQKNTSLANYSEWVKSRFSGSSVFGVSKEIFRKGKYFTPFGGRVSTETDRKYRWEDDLSGRNSYRNLNK